MTMPRFLLRGAALAAALALSLPAKAQQGTPFRFGAIDSLESMRSYLRDAFPPGAPRTALRSALAGEGNATHVVHPRRAGSDKYLYDINICDAYIWRWNISADFDDAGALVQAYVNGDPVHPSGPQKIDPRSLGKGGKAAIYKLMRARPEAHKGETQLAYLLLDADANRMTPDDQLVIGGGPNRPQPGPGTKLYAYSGVELWRSIFDPDAAARIHGYDGPCPAGPAG